jgi:hypothetical protein
LPSTEEMQEAVERLGRVTARLEDAVIGLEDLGARISEFQTRIAKLESGSLTSGSVPKQ